MIDLAGVPAIDFLTPRGPVSLRVSEQLEVVAGRAARLRERFAPGERVGLIHRTGPDLVLEWLAALAMGLVPTILQYPTAKQNRESWEKSIAGLMRGCRLAGLIVADRSVVPECATDQFTIISASPVARYSNIEPAITTGTIIQMSSGTTGQRKPIAYSLEQLRTHVACYNETVRMSGDDVVVSWLPLYHDMGFIACFVMPMLTGTRSVLIDPMDWISDPDSLYRAIENWRGTICYMPNFGFEVMARRGGNTALGSMRKWISCAEPISATTVRRFLAVTGTEPERFAGCYAMAENVFAIAQSQGFTEVRIGDKVAVSCGTPIRGAEIKIVDDELWVRSPTSIESYLDAAPVVDDERYYPTGDIGQITDCGLAVLGRKHDVLIQAGTKHFLSDLDAVVNEVAPDVRGRACTVAAWDEREGTQHPLILIERQHFFADEELAEMGGPLRDAAGLAHLEIAFVPPFFISKTSSGKLNRKETLRQWEAVEAARHAHRRRDIAGMQTDILKYFTNFSFDAPVGEILDSLGITVLRMILADYGQPFDPDNTLAEFIARCSRAGAVSAGDEVAGVRIVSCADGRHWQWVTERDLQEMEKLLGCPVHFEHICAPPAPVLFSDVVFGEYFLTSRNGPDFASLENLLAKIRVASVLVFDDIAELGFGTGVFPVLNHRFEREPVADLLCYRWQRYSANHDKLPITAMDLRDFTKEERALTFARLSEYLRIPIFRIAVLESHQDFTSDWEYREIRPGNTLETQQTATPERLRHALFAFLERHGGSLPRTRGPSQSTFSNTDLPHFCCSYVDASALESVLSRYGSFAVIGPPQSVTHIKRRAAELGKEVNYLSIWNSSSPESRWELDGVAEECVLCTGAWGSFVSTTKPVFQVMLAYPGRLADNIPSALEHLRYGFASTGAVASSRSFYRAWE